MGKKISIDQLYDEVEDIITAWETSVQEKTDAITERYAKIGAETLRQNSPKRTGKYSKGWTYTKSGAKGRRIAVGSSATIYNKTNWQLCHLLEFGHALRNGGRARAIPHIKPVEEKLQEEYPAAIEEMLKNNQS